MRKYAVLVLPLWLWAAACSSSSDGSSDDEGNQNQQSGSAAQGTTCGEVGETQCQGTSTLLTCTSGAWQGDACATGKVCGAAPGTVGVYACINAPPPAGGGGDGGGGGGGGSDGPAAEFEDCDAEIPCETGLQCQGDLGLCVKPCQVSTAATDCGEGHVCQPTSVANPQSGICFGNTAQRDDACLVNGNTCAEGQGACMQVNEEEFGCKVGCDSIALGTQGACPESELCLPATGLVQPQDPEVACTTPGTSEGCNAAEGYTCFSLSGGDKICARRSGWCGSLTPMLGAFSQSAVQAHVVSGKTCDFVTGHAGCAIVGATGTPAMVDCVELTKDRAGNSIAVCIGSCGASENNPDLDCGTGFHCDRPAADQSFFFELQQSEDEPVTCTEGNGTACDEAQSYTCNGPFTGDMFYCSRPSKVCMSN